MPKEKYEGSKDRMRREIYESQCVRGVFTAGERTKYDANKIKEQSGCPRHSDDLKWGANGASIHASCGRCGARTVVQFAPKREKMSFMTVGPEPEVQPTLSSWSRCRRSLR